MTELKPCPFCDSTNAKVAFSADPPECFVKCSCKARGPAFYDSGHVEHWAISAWNGAWDKYHGEVRDD